MHESCVKRGKEPLDHPAQLAAQCEGTPVSPFPGLVLHVSSKELIVGPF